MGWAAVFISVIRTIVGDIRTSVAFIRKPDETGNGDAAFPFIKGVPGDRF